MPAINKSTMLFEPDFPLDQIIPRERRTRLRTTETEKVLSQSIERFGWVQPLTIDARYWIVDGQYRFELAKKWKLATVPVVITNGVTQRDGTTESAPSYLVLDLYPDMPTRAADGILQPSNGGARSCPPTSTGG